jgi:NTP pyrophosphatase (non-canonical NTP hydrolase)
MDTKIAIADAVFVHMVQEEVSRARKKFPTNKHLVVALVEEVGEVAKALQDETREQLIAELVQVAAMALRLAVEGDPDYERSLANHSAAAAESVGYNNRKKQLRARSKKVEEKTNG